MLTGRSVFYSVEVLVSPMVRVHPASFFNPASCRRSALPYGLVRRVATESPTRSPHFGGLGRALVAIATAALGLTLWLGGPATAQPSGRGGTDAAPDPLVAPVVPPPSGNAYLGVTVFTNSPSWRELLKRSEAQGALVVLVDPASPAANAGLAVGDVIVGIDGAQVRSGEEVGRLLRSSQATSRELTVVGADGRSRTVSAYPASRRPDALRFFERRLAADPSPANRFVFADGARDARAALAVVDRLIREFPGFALAYATKAKRLTSAAVADRDLSPERVDPARAALAKAVELDPDSPAVRLTAAGVLGTLGDTAAAKVHAERAVEVDDASAEAHHLVGLSTLDLNQPRAALADLYRAIQLDGYEPQHYVDLSRAYRAVGRPDLAAKTDEAIRELRRPRRALAGGQPVRAAVGLGAALLVGVVLWAWAGRSPPEVVKKRAKRKAETATPPPRVWLLEAASAAALFSMVVPFLGQMLSLSARGEVAIEIRDHLVPGVIVAGLCALGLRMLFTREPSAEFFHVLALLNAGAGLWMILAHLPMTTRGFGHGATVEELVWHLVPGVVITALALPIHTAFAEPGQFRPNLAAAARTHQRGGVRVRSR